MYHPGVIPAGTVQNNLACQIDLYKTFASVIETDFDTGKATDSIDISSLIFDNAAQSPREVFLYYRGGRALEAVRCGDYKLKIAEGKDESMLLFNLRDDIGEQNNLYGSQPEIAGRLLKLIEEARADIGDDRLGIEGSGVRPVGRVENAVTLTYHDEDFPYIIAMYDKEDSG
jgi:arylsulfatase